MNNYSMVLRAYEILVQRGVIPADVAQEIGRTGYVGLPPSPPEHGLNYKIA